MTVKCSCGFIPKNYQDILRHVVLMDKRGADGHGADVSEWNIRLCPIHPNRELYDNGFCKDCGRCVLGENE